MVDQKGLGRIGIVFAMVTGAVMLTGILVVSFDRDFVTETSRPLTVTAALGSVAR